MSAIRQAAAGPRMAAWCSIPSTMPANRSLTPNARQFLNPCAHQMFAGHDHLPPVLHPALLVQAVALPRSMTATAITPARPSIRGHGDDANLPRTMAQDKCQEHAPNNYVAGHSTRRVLACHARQERQKVAAATATRVRSVRGLSQVVRR
jgi:hypothetical protein